MLLLLWFPQGNSSDLLFICHLYKPQTYFLTFLIACVFIVKTTLAQH